MKAQKKQFRIGHVAQELGVERFVIRFWEKEFKLKAIRSDGGQRFYRQKDIDQFKFIKTLLYEKGFTIAGAKKMLEDRQSPLNITGSTITTFDHQDQNIVVTTTVNDHLKTISEQLKKLRTLLEN